MAKKFNFKNKSLWKKIGIGACCGVLGLGAVMGVGALLNNQEEVTTKNINPTYAVGGLTEDGKYLETKESIYTKDAFACQGLDIDLAFNNNVSYRVFFYDADNNFISATENLTENYDENTTPIASTYARIVITPHDDDKVSWYEVNGYSKQLEIEVNKEQVTSGLVISRENVFKLAGYGGITNDLTLNASDTSSTALSEIINVKDYTDLFVTYPLENLHDKSSGSSYDRFNLWTIYDGVADIMEYEITSDGLIHFDVSNTEKVALTVSRDLVDSVIINLGINYDLNK